MRTVIEIPLSDFKITVFVWNNKYIIKIEKGNYEQTYKVSEMELSGDDDIIKMVKDEQFIALVRTRFKEMNESLNDVLNRIN